MTGGSRDTYREYSEMMPTAWAAVMGYPGGFLYKKGENTM